MKIKWSLYNYEGYPFKEGLKGEYMGNVICTSYINHPIFMLCAKFRIWLRSKILGSNTQNIDDKTIIIQGIKDRI